MNNTLIKSILCLGIGNLFISGFSQGNPQRKAPKLDLPKDISVRCKDDSLDINQAYIRLDWAAKHNVIPEEILYDYIYRATKDGKVKRDRPSYPMFGTWDGVPANSKVWKPEQANFPALLPSNIFWLNGCVASCYTDDQEVLMESGYAILSEMVENNDRESKIAIVSKDSTLNSISLESDEIGTYTKSFRETTHKIRVFSTESGGELKVTLGHPILDGNGILKEASSFAKGDFLVTEYGTKDKIISIEEKEYFGKVYNVRPKNEDIKTNLIVAQGFINGSDRFQNDWANQINRKILVSQVPETIF